LPPGSGIGIRFHQLFDPERLKPVPLLFQTTGDLTIKSITWEDDAPIYRLELPDAEARRTFTDHLFEAYIELQMEEMIRLQGDIRRQIKTCDSEGLTRSLRAIIAYLPYPLHIGDGK
jgi:hypothetical protein